MADKVATYSVNVTSNAKDAGNEGAVALEKLKGSVTSSLQAIKDMSASMKSLRGSTDEVKKVKDELKGKIEAERSALSANNLALLKAGTSYTKLSEETKKAAAESAKHGAESKRLLGPLGELRERFDALKEKMGSAGGVVALFAVGALAAVAVILKIGAALASATKDLVEWIVQTGLANREMALHREAYSGSAANARALGHDLDALAGKVATPRAELEKLAASTVKALNNSRVSGQGIMDTYNAIAQASAAMGDEVGARLAEMVARAKNTGRVVINPVELAGTGLKVQDIGAQLAKSMHMGVAAATAALQQGRVGVNDFAAALRAAAEVRFGNLNELQRLGQPMENLRKRLTALADGVNLEPLLRGFEELSKLFDASTVEGSGLKQLITWIGNSLGPAFQGGLPVIKEAFIRIEIGVVKVIIAMQKARIAIASAFKGHEDIYTMANALKDVKTLIDGVAGGAVWMVQSFAVGFGLTIRTIFAVGDAVKSVQATLRGWVDFGRSIIDGIISGLESGIEKIKATITKIAEGIKGAFTGKLEIRSPSKVFEKYGEQTTEGYKRGVDKGAPGAQAAADGMAPSAPGGGGTDTGATGGGRGAPISIVVNLHAGGGGEEAAKKLAAPTFLADLTKAIQDALVGAGLPVQAQAPT